MAERPPSRRARRYLASLADRRVNFPEASLEDVGPAQGWVVDDHSTPLGGEAPGPPAPGGLWARACALVADYRFADPRLIRAVYEPGAPLMGRDMLLRGRFLGLDWHLGARVVHAGGEVREEDGRTVDRWGWGYRTLQGHLEMGQMDFWVVKDRGTGEVWFRIHAVSKPAPVPNPVVRWGFRLFGRGLQLRFAREAGLRMRRLVAEADAPVAAGGSPAAGSAAGP
jgi:uncharacterized protein (UPF0548 family)